MGWLRTDYQFDLPIATLVLPDRLAASVLARLNEQQGNKDVDVHAGHLGKTSDPNSLAGWLAGAAAALRPDLTGLIVVGLNFNFVDRTWEIQAAHPSLPPKNPALRPDVVYLDPPGTARVRSEGGGPDVLMLTPGPAEIDREALLSQMENYRGWDAPLVPPTTKKGVVKDGDWPVTRVRQHPDGTFHPTHDTPSPQDPPAGDDCDEPFVR